MPKKRRETRSYEFDPEVRREIEKQAQAQQEIESRRKKRTLIFWGGAILVLWSSQPYPLHFYYY